MRRAARRHAALGRSHRWLPGGSLGFLEQSVQRPFLPQHPQSLYNHWVKGFLQKPRIDLGGPQGRAVGPVAGKGIPDIRHRQDAGLDGDSLPFNPSG